MAYRILRERKSDDGFALHLGRTFSSEALHRALLGVFGVQTVREWPLIFLCEHLTEGIKPFLALPIQHQAYLCVTRPRASHPLTL